MLKRLICALLSLTLLLAALPVSALAALEATETTMYVGADALPVYKSPALSGKRLATCWFGQSVTVMTKYDAVAMLHDGKNRIGYCELAQLLDSDPHTYNMKVYVQAKKAPVYAGCSTGSGKLGTLKRGAEVTMVAVNQDGRWVRVKYKDGYGYIQHKLVDDAPYAEGTPAWGIYDGTLAVMSTVKGWDDIGKLCLGDAVTLLGTDNGWAKLRNVKGEIGWCAAEFISTKSPIVNQTVYAQITDKFLAKQPGGAAGLKVNRKIKKNAKLTLVAQGDFWARVKYDGKTYYIPAIYLGEDKASAAGKLAVTERQCDLQDAPKIAGGAIGQLPQGALVRLLAGGPLFAKVAVVDAKGIASGAVGWVLVTQLTSY